MPPRKKPVTPAAAFTRESAWELIENWFRAKGWLPQPFQRETWAAFESGKSGLLHLPTGAGKTYGAYFGPLVDALVNPEPALQVLYITPLRALSRDIEKALLLPVEELGLPLRVESRTGDTSGHVRKRQRLMKPNVLVTTPESLSLLLSYETAPEDFKSLRAVIIDEWHELISTKRGTLLELSLSRLRTLAPQLKTWALSATLANTQEAAQSAVGLTSVPEIIAGDLVREVNIETILPESVDAFPWAGHLGLKMLPKVIDRLDLGVSTLIFTNTRSQAERWYHALLEKKPDWATIMALHHGSLARKERERVEAGMKEGTIKIVVCTSSLDLGIDLAPVEQVIQIGSAKGIARLIQRAGRSAHSPGLPCRILFVPTHSLELIEISAAREAVHRKQVEARRSQSKPYDVLAQHLVTRALGGGFTPSQILSEVRNTVAYRDLTDEEFDWTLTLVRDGGATLHAYPGYHRIELEGGIYRVKKTAIAKQHRLNIGTITSDASVLVRYANGPKLGSIEESYITRLRRGEKFLFAGKLLELILVRDLVAYVRRTSGKTAHTPRWSGGRMPLSASLSQAMRQRLEEIREGDRRDPETQKAGPVIDAQLALSTLPRSDELLVELCHTREGHHLYLYPFEGRLVHEGLAAILALRLARKQPTSFSLSVNDYGIELMTADDFPFETFLEPSLFTVENLTADALASVNLAELARRQFREVARVAGLVWQNYNGAEKTGRQLQASASLLYDVFKRYDPENLLLRQAQQEVLNQHFEQSRLVAALVRIGSAKLRVMKLPHPSPLGFPLLVDRFGARLSTQTLLERIERMKRQWSKPKTKSKFRGKSLASLRSGPSSGGPKTL